VGRLLVALGSHLILFPAATHARVHSGFWLNPCPQLRFNEGPSGPAGTFFVFSMLYNVHTDGSFFFYTFPSPRDVALPLIPSSP
ncbi:SMP-30/gluconolactonase/LRE family protein, partial [Burkholderia pseudomallei]|nr:SMP-30/gluconolactonase/LRE family protein [Burkholderia pseudomallei]